MSLVTAQQTLAYRNAVAKENKLRTSYYLARFGPGAKPSKGEDVSFYDPWNNDKVSPINGIKRCLLIPEISGHRSWSMLKHTGRLVTPPREGTPLCLPDLNLTEAPSRPASISRGSASAPNLSALLSAEEPPLEERPFSTAERTERSRRSVASLRTVVEEAVRAEIGKTKKAPPPRQSEAAGARRAPKSPKMMLVTSNMRDYTWPKQHMQSAN
eukprot:TRINITY_DN33866_c0_g2_i1.p1 TRINITY_DN33866_c0_g2~~TRINITY_DN33866_c0_g2_i1.p1  ORF type:complete len:213 (+),score=31.36 TRINITY_DN33866_c0_g2_i1:215-853(+)